MAVLITSVYWHVHINIAHADADVKSLAEGTVP